MPFVETAEKRYKDRVYLQHFYRRGGKRRVIKGEPGSQEFAANYRRIHDEYEGRAGDHFIDGTFGALVFAYKASAEFMQLGDRTKAEYRRHLDTMSAEWRDLPAVLMERKHVLAYRDRFIKNPSVGNAKIKVLKRLLSWALDRDWIKINPAARVGAMKEGEYRAWPDAVIQQFRESNPPLEILHVFELAIHTGQRQADLLSMTWHQYNGAEIEVRQQKTDETVWIPAHAALKAALGAIPRNAVNILVSKNGQPWKRYHFSRLFRKATADAGVEGYVFHGLRKSAAVRLAEAGCPPDEIKAITGHKTNRMVEHYTKDADRKRLARAAVARLERPES